VLGIWLFYSFTSAWCFESFPPHLNWLGIVQVWSYFSLGQSFMSKELRAWFICLLRPPYMYSDPSVIFLTFWPPWGGEGELERLPETLVRVRYNEIPCSYMSWPTRFPWLRWLKSCRRITSYLFSPPPYTFCVKLRLSIVIYYAITKSSATVISLNLNLVFVCDSINHSIRKFVFGQWILNDNFSWLHQV
jgi:hypothetical protein